MVIADFDIFGLSISPMEADAPLVVDPDRVLTAPVAGERLQPIARRGPQILQTLSPVDKTQLLQRRSLDVGREPAGTPTGPYSLGLAISETPDHCEI
jgi:hypothetical protein